MAPITALEAPRLALDAAAAGDHVGRGSARDHPDVRGRPLVEAPEAHRRDRRPGGLDGAPPLLGPDAGVRLGALEVGGQALVGRRRGDDFADRARVIEHEAERRAQCRELELLGPSQALLLGDREHELEPRGRRRARVTGGQLHQHCDGGLVVGAEDRLAAAAKDTFLQHHVDGPVVGHRVEVSGEHHPAIAATRHARHEVPRARPRPRGGAILGDVDVEVLQLGEDRVGDRPLLSCRARDLAKPDEAIEHALIVYHAPKAMRGSPRCARRWRSA
jgi:hypothetical protein